MHVVYALEHGGTERFLCRLLNRLASGSARHVLCTLRQAGARARMLDPRIEVVALDLPDKSRLGFCALARAIRDTRAAIVHARNLCTWTDALLAGRLARNTRVVLGFHGRQHIGRFNPGRRRRLRALGVSRADMTSVSHAGRQLLADELGGDVERIHVLPNGVDVALFQPPSAAQRQAARRKFDIPEKSFAVGNVGNLFAPIKGHAELIQAFAQVLRVYPDALLLIAGFGPLDQALRRLAADLGIPRRVRLLGQVEPITDLLAALDLYVCPSLTEGMSNALLEAQACGLPCVATDVADHRRTLPRHQALGLLPQPGDVAALAAAIVTLAAQEDLRAETGRRSRELITREYTFEAAASRYAQLYTAMLTRDGRSLAHRMAGVPCPS